MVASSFIHSVILYWKHFLNLKADENVWIVVTSFTLVFENVDSVLWLLSELFITHCVSAQLGEMVPAGFQIQV